MIIKCPQCATGYNIPDKVLSDKPRKMRCAKCKNMFTVARRAEKTPQGYMEYTGGHQLPAEFAFLQAQPSLTPDAAPTVPLPVLEKEESLPSPESSPAPNMPPPPQTPAVQEAQRAQQVDELAAAQGCAAQAAIEELRQGGGTPIGNSLPAETMFGANSSAWEVEAPLELGEYSVAAQEPPKDNQMVGKIVFGIFVFLVSVFVFVAFRNNWKLSLSQLPDQVAFAFSGEATESFPDAVENMEAMVVTRKVIAGKKATFLSVSGDITNNNPGSRSNVIVRARLYDGNGDMRGEAKMPCRRSVEDKLLKTTAKGALAAHFLTNGKVHDCSISPNGSALFQVVFDDVPDDYDASFQIKVQIVSATAQ